MYRTLTDAIPAPPTMFIMAPHACQVQPPNAKRRGGFGPVALRCCGSEPSNRAWQANVHRGEPAETDSMPGESRTPIPSTARSRCSRPHRSTGDPEIGAETGVGGRGVDRAVVGVEHRPGQAPRGSPGPR